MKKIFFDTEFTGLHQNTTLISIGMVAESGESFYGELSDFNYRQVDNWIHENVISKLIYYPNNNNMWGKCTTEICDDGSLKTNAYGTKSFIAASVDKWLRDQGKCQMWSDCLSYDWVLFNSLWCHALNLPKNIYYIPFDICTMFEIKGINPDINREEFVGISNSSKKHNALYDATIIKLCYEKLRNMSLFLDKMDVIVNLDFNKIDSLIEKIFKVTAESRFPLENLPFVINKIHNAIIKHTKEILFIKDIYKIIEETLRYHGFIKQAEQFINQRKELYYEN